MTHRSDGSGSTGDGRGLRALPLLSHLSRGERRARCDVNTFGHSDNITAQCVPSIEEALLAQAVPRSGAKEGRGDRGRRRGLKEGADMSDPSCGHGLAGRGGHKCSKAGIATAATAAKPGPTRRTS